MPLAAAWARAADIDRQLQASARAAAAGSVMLRAEVRGSTRTCHSQIGGPPMDVRALGAQGTT